MISQVIHTGTNQSYQTTPVNKLAQLKEHLLAGKTLICDTADYFYVFQYKNGSVLTKFVQYADAADKMYQQTHYIDFANAINIITTMWQTDDIDCCYCSDCGFDGDELNFKFDQPGKGKE